MIQNGCGSLGRTRSRPRKLNAHISPCLIRLVFSAPSTRGTAPPACGWAVSRTLAQRRRGVAGRAGGEGALALRPAVQPVRVAEQFGQRHGHGDNGGPGSHRRAHDVPAPGREVAKHAPDGVVRHCHGDLDDGLQELHHARTQCFPVRRGTGHDQPCL